MSETYELVKPVTPTAIGFKLQQIAEMCDVSVRTVHNWISHGYLRTTKVDGTTRVQEADWEEFRTNMGKGLYGKSHHKG